MIYVITPTLSGHVPMAWYFDVKTEYDKARAAANARAVPYCTGRTDTVPDDFITDSDEFIAWLEGKGIR